MAKIKLPLFTGGLNLNEATTIEDNELAKAQNVFYDTDNKLTTRRGIANFKSPISDQVTIVHNCDTFNGNGTWVGSDDAVNITTDAITKRQGSGSVNFDITVATSPNDYATLDNTTLGAVNLTSVSETGTFKFWAYIPDITNFTSIQLRVGGTLTTSDWEDTVSTDAAGNAFVSGWNRISIPWATMNKTGSPTGNITAVRVRFNYAAGYTDQTDARIDGIYWYSDGSTKPVQNLYQTKIQDGTRYTLATAGTGIFLLNEITDSWDLIATGYTDGSRFTFANFKDSIYFTNGIDDYSRFNPANFAAAGNVITTYPGVPKGKYLFVQNDIGYLANAPGDRSTVFYSAANPVDLTLFPNIEPVSIDDGFEINGLSNLGSIILAAKGNKIHTVNVAASPVQIQEVDYSNGVTSHWTIQAVENDRFFLSDNGIFSLSQRQGVTGSYRATPLSFNIQPLIESSRNLENSNAFYWDKLNHYYINLDTNNDGVTDTCMVYNIKLKAWTQYTNINANQIIEYEDSDGELHLIYANAFSGQVREMETGFNDNGIGISVAIYTKEYDFKEPTLTKEIREIDVSGFMSDLAEISFIADIDDNDTALADWKVLPEEITTQFITLGTHPLGINPLTGQPIVGSGIPLYLFNRRIPVYVAGTRIQIRLESTVEDSAWVLSKILLVSQDVPFDFFATDSIL